uniref:Uncharacterized protein n=1 Tax=Rhizophora mucronata TaxID=61149 RepID=A0A2P2P454_RHIMU
MYELLWVLMLNSFVASLEC